MKGLILRATGVLLATLLAAGSVAAYHSIAAFQLGPAGVGMEVVETKGDLARTTEANELPLALPPASQGGQLAVDAYKNVQVLGHLSSGDVTRLMTAITTWVAPVQGCGYCHAPQRDAGGNIVMVEDPDTHVKYPQADPNNLQSDELYTKVVARRMLQMTMHINSDWKVHVSTTGVTCYTCHRGNNVPTNIWYNQPEGDTRFEGIPGPARKYIPATAADLSSLPNAALQVYLRGDSARNEIRIQDQADALGNNRTSIKEAEWTYSLMLHISNSLGVNCTYCHNSRSFGDWSQSPQTRTTAWYGIRMARELNGDYLEPLQSTFPANRLGPLGDGPKLNCATCHNGAYKPLLGQSMLADYPALAQAMPQPQKTPVVPVPSPEGAVGPLGDASVDGSSDAGAPLDAGRGDARAPTFDASAPAPASASPSTSAHP